MELSKLLSQDTTPSGARAATGLQGSSTHGNVLGRGHHLRQHAASEIEIMHKTSDPRHSRCAESSVSYPSHSAAPKAVNFQLLLSEAGEHRARLPLRVNVRAHDTTESIISTVKNFYGLYQEQGISFEDSHGAGLIARYENFENNTTVYVRVPAVQLPPAPEMRESMSPTKPQLQEPFQMLPPTQGQQSGRSSRKRSLSPASDLARRSGLNRPPLNPKNLSVWTDMHGDRESHHNHSDNDSMSVSSSRRGRDNLASAEISTDNIVEGGRRKRAKFESSELPLFQPPTFPMNPSMSSASPQRRNNNGPVASPLPYGSAHVLAGHPLLSPQSLSYSENSMSLNGAINSRPAGARLSGGHRNPRLSGGSMSGILPTPAPTVGSMISDEDVAYQLMRLGEAPRTSHGRLSASTADDALSGKAEAASSDDFSEAGSEDEELSMPVKKRMSVNSGGHTPERDSDLKHKHAGHVKRPKQSHPVPIKAKKASTTDIPPSPYSLANGRKESVSSEHHHSHAGGDDEDDLSSKPRCQRCRKSKKGCDRQRPCGRCKDAGIGIEGCVSEDEGNGRKGRFGRHMGVPIKKPASGAASPPMPFEAAYGPPPSMMVDAASAAAAIEKSKKRKR